jgi:RNA polymerase sigma factor (sigma-70 family)
MATSPPQSLAALVAPVSPVERDRAWEEFLAGHNRLLLYVARSFGGDYDAAMDRYAFLLEQLRHDDFRRLRAFADDGRSDFTTWLVVVSQRICLDYRRSRYGRPRGAADSPSAAEHVTRRRLADLVGVSVEEVELADAESFPPDELLVLRETTSALTDALESLSFHDQLLLQLRFNDDVSIATIADIVGYPTRFHAYRRIEQALAKLKANLAERGIDNPHG